MVVWRHSLSGGTSRRWVALLFVAGLYCVMGGCLDSQADQSISVNDQVPVDGPATDQGQQSSGQVSVPIQTGVTIEQATPIGLVVLMALQMLLSHRREMSRIRCKR